MTTITRITQLAAVAALGLAISSPAQAECRRKIDLHGALPGDFSGKAEVREQGTAQKFKVSVDARVADGTTYIVTANGFAVGTMTIRLGDGELELSNSNGKTLPNGASPVCSVGPVSVLDSGGRTILNGAF